MVDAVETVEGGDSGRNAHAPYDGCVCRHLDEDHHFECQQPPNELHDTEGHDSLTRSLDSDPLTARDARHEVVRAGR